MRKYILMLAAAFASVLPVTLTSCSDDDEEDAPTEVEETTISEKIIGYWNGFYESSGLTSYTFASFDSKGNYAIFLNDDVFSSGTYTVADNNITLKSGYDDKTTTITVSKVSSESITLSINSKTYSGTKTSKSAVDLDNIFIGKSYTSYLAQKPIVTTFYTKYSATREYQRSVTQKLYIYWQYVYNGTNLYVKNFESPNEQHATVGGWNTYEDGKVYIYNVALSGGNIESLSKIEEQK